MIKRTERDQRTQEEKGTGVELGDLVGPMLTGMATTRHDLLAWVHAHGLAALDEMFGAEAVALAGPKGRHQPQRTHHHWGTVATELTFGGRRVQVRRPRVRQTIGGEATLPSPCAAPWSSIAGVSSPAKSACSRVVAGSSACARARPAKSSSSIANSY